MSKEAVCPACKQSSTIEFWDENTKKENGIDPDDKYLSAGAPIDKLAEVEAVFRCPLCNKEVEGTKMIKND